MMTDEVPMTPLEFYRSSAVGEALIKSLNELLEAKVLPDDEALKILEVFDQSFQNVLREHILLKKDVLLGYGEGELANYNNIENLWKLEVKDLKLQIGESQVFGYDRAHFLCSETSKK